MEKTRVKKGEKYWSIEGNIVLHIENDSIEDEARFYGNNYFVDLNSAEAMAEKIRKVLKGAEMIEMSKAVLAFNDFLAKLKDDGIISYDKGCEYMKEFQSKLVK